MRHILIILTWYVVTGLLITMRHSISHERELRRRNHILAMAKLPHEKDTFWLGIFAGALVSLIWPWVLYKGFSRAVREIRNRR